MIPDRRITAFYFQYEKHLPFTALLNPNVSTVVRARDRVFHGGLCIQRMTIRRVFPFGEFVVGALLRFLQFPRERLVTTLAKIPAASIPPKHHNRDRIGEGTTAKMLQA